VNGIVFRSLPLCLHDSKACGAGLCITKCLFCFVQRFHSCCLIHVRKIVRPPGRQTLATTWRKVGGNQNQKPVKYSMRAERKAYVVPQK
jgi:hypothetical protein